nr:hypothetical protein Iba_chr03aCG17580 [Ipomoea batatas]
MNTPTGVLKRHQTLRSSHPGSADVQPPRHPVGGGDPGVTVGDIGGVVSLVVGPVENRIKHRQIIAGSKYSVPGESEIRTTLSVKVGGWTRAWLGGYEIDVIYVKVSGWTRAWLGGYEIDVIYLSGSSPNYEGFNDNDYFLKFV